ncbi:MAG: DUF885 domain-containing protein [Gemmatimonadaceae bacterium]
MTPRRRLVLCGFGALGILGASIVSCARLGVRDPEAPPATAPGAAAAHEWDAFVENYLDRYFAAHPDVAVVAGRHEYDGSLPDWSPRALTREARRLRAWREDAAVFDTTGLDARRRFERAYLIAQADGDLFWLERAGWPYRNPTFYIGALDPEVYVSRPYAPLPVRMRAYVRYARSVPTAARQIRRNMRTLLPRTYVDRAVSAFGGLAEFYTNDVPRVFAPVSDPRLQAEFRRANAGAAAALRELAAWFAAQRPRATDTYAIGAGLFSDMLSATERVDVSLAELERVGRADLERNLRALRDACASYAPGRSLDECTRRVRANKPPDGPVAGARRQLGRLRQFIVENNLVTIPGPEQAGVAEAPPYNRANLAYINIPGPYETNLPSTYYIAPPDPTWSSQEREEYLQGEAPLLFVSVHEVWPGHFLQFLHANRSPSKFGQVFVGYAFAEGWAHYAEEMMWDAGLGSRSPETHIGQLMNALLRNVRYLSAIGLHTGGMRVAESERMFREQAFQDPGNARQQAARGTYDPAYLNYTMGKLMIRKLRDDWTASRASRAAWREFHDTFLSYGGPPIPLVRRAMVRTEGSLF